MFRRILYFLGLNFVLLITFSVVAFFLPLPQNYYGQTLILYAVFGFGGAFISLLLSRKMAKWLMRVQVIDTQKPKSETEKWLVSTVHELARKAGLPGLPEVGIFDANQLNAFATGPTKSRSLVAVSTGLLNNMTRDEVEGVLGHEVAHIKNGDMVTMVLLQGTINTLVMFAARILSDVVASAISKDERGGFWMRFALFQVFAILLGFLGMLITGSFSRIREYRADEGGARLTSPDKMIRALEKLKAHYHPEERPKSKQHESMAALQISGRYRRSTLTQLISTHPPLESRISELKKRRL